MEATHPEKHREGAPTQDATPPRRKHTRSKGRWVFWGFAAVAAFFLLTEHRAHLFGVLPFLLLALCPLMHLFHGHGGSEGHARHAAADRDPSQGERK